MGPQSEGGPSGDGRGYGGQQFADNQQSRYQSDRDIVMQDQQLQRPGPAFGTENRGEPSPSGSTNGREMQREADPHKTSGERNRSRGRNGRTASGQLRMCKKCGEPLTGQFVRALGGTFHLDCFRCRVGCSSYSLNQTNRTRIVVKLWLRNSSPSTRRTARDNTHCAKQITSAV
jgi:hypothetical protein